jgi:membrane associated rhomboid family serine protease
MFIPYSVDVPMERWPIANWVLIAVTTIISIALFLGVEDNDRTSPHIDPKLWKKIIENKLPPEEVDKIFEDIQRRMDAEAHGPPWALKPNDFTFLQLFSCQFAHADALHLVGNMFFLFCFGNAVNAKLGHFLFLICYLSLGTVASMGWLLFGNGQPALGASGSIMGILGMFLVFFPRNDVKVFYLMSYAIAGSLYVSSIYLILSYLVCDFLGTLYGGGGVAYVAHLAGSLAGILVALIMVDTRWIKSTRYEENLLQMMGWQNNRRR